MDLDKIRIRQGIIIITYTALLILVIINFKSVIAGVGVVLKLLTPFFAGIVIAFVLNRPYEWIKQLYLERMRMKSGPANALAIVTVYLLLVGVVIAVLLTVVPQLVQNIQMLTASIDEIMKSLQDLMNTVTQALGLKQVDLTELSKYIETYIVQIQELAKDVLPKIAVITMNAISAIVNVFLAVAFSVYLMSEKQRIMDQIRRIVCIFATDRIESRIYSVTHTIITVFDNYVAGQALEAVILGSLCFAGMLVLGLEYAGMVSVVVAITAMIPILGAYVGGGMAVVLLLCVAPKKALIFLVFFVLLQQVENNVIYPRVVGNKIGLPGIWVLLAITIGGKLMGVVGMLFGVPVMTVIYTLLKNSIHNKEQKEEIVKKQ